MFGFKTRELEASEVARWLAKHAGKVRTTDARQAMLYAKAAMALSAESTVDVERVQDFLAQ
jgi:hypothetical protein